MKRYGQIDEALGAVAVRRRRQARRLVLRRLPRWRCASARGRYEYLKVDLCVRSRGVERIELSVPSDVNRFLRDVFPDVAAGVQEHFVAVALDSQHQAVGAYLVSKGSIDEAHVRPADVLRLALLLPAVALIVAHNHPSGTLEPSPSDMALTRKLSQTAALVGLRLLDHLILVADAKRYFSFQERGMMPSP